MAGTMEENLRQCGKVLAAVMAHKDAGPFLEPVRWKEWGLLDYPKVVKNPMDLGTVKTKLETGQYMHYKEFKHDVNLVWNNSMTYNADGSDYYILAATLKRVFEEKFAKAVKEDGAEGDVDARPPTLLDKKMFSQNIYNISSEDLGRVVHMLDQRCESAIKKIDPEDIEIDIDSIDAATFWAVDAFVKECLPGARRAAPPGRSKTGGGAPAAPAAPKAGGGGGGGAGGASGDASASKAKRARVSGAS